MGIGWVLGAVWSSVDGLGGYAALMMGTWGAIE